MRTSLQLAVILVSGLSIACIAKAFGGADSMEDQVVAAEKAGLEALMKGDLVAFGKLTADEAVFVDASGTATKAQVMKNVADFNLTYYSMEDVRYVPIDKSTGLIAYKVTETGNSHGHGFSAKAYVSSVWTKRKGEWLCLFSQETATK